MTIHQEIKIGASPDRVYRALTDARQFSDFSGGAPAAIDAAPGGPFSCFGDRVTGRNIELVPGKRVVQAWRAGTWPEGLYSIVRFELAAEGAGTRILFDQSGHPEDQAHHLEEGWHKMYWDGLKTCLG